MGTTTLDSLAVARGLATALATDAAARDLERRFPHAELDLVKRSGRLALLVPRADGGLGGTPGDLIRTVGILAEGDPSVAQMTIVHHSGVELLNKIAPPATVSGRAGPAAPIMPLTRKVPSRTSVGPV